MTLGDKIIVMNRGDIQQVGTPHEVFFSPRNAFVANFVGTPSMNIFLGGVRIDESGNAFVQLSGLELGLPGRSARVCAGWRRIASFGASARKPSNWWRSPATIAS